MANMNPCYFRGDLMNRRDFTSAAAASGLFSLFAPVIAAAQEKGITFADPRVQRVASAVIQENFKQLGMRPQDIRVTVANSAESVPNSKRPNFSVPGVMKGMMPGNTIRVATITVSEKIKKELVGKYPGGVLQRAEDGLGDAMDSVLDALNHEAEIGFLPGVIILGVVYGVLAVAQAGVKVVKAIGSFIKKLFTRKNKGVHDVDLDGDGIPDPVGDVRPSVVLQVAPRMLSQADQVANLEGGQLEFVLGGDARAFASMVRFNYDGQSAGSTMLLTT